MFQCEKLLTAGRSVNSFTELKACAHKEKITVLTIGQFASESVTMLHEME